MRKTLCIISEEDMDYGITLMSNLGSLKTLLTIIKDDETRTRISKEIFEFNEKINAFWNEITNKYNIPYYADRMMHLNATNNSVYIFE